MISVDTEKQFERVNKLVWAEQGWCTKGIYKFCLIKNGVYIRPKPDRFLEKLHETDGEGLSSSALCAGYEAGLWRCEAFAFHLAEWLPEYALPEEELGVNHANSLLKIRQAAIRVYTSPK